MEPSKTFSGASQALVKDLSYETYLAKLKKIKNMLTKKGQLIPECKNEPLNFDDLKPVDFFKIKHKN